MTICDIGEPSLLTLSNIQNIVRQEETVTKPPAAKVPQKTDATPTKGTWKK